MEKYADELKLLGELDERHDELLRELDELDKQVEAVWPSGCPSEKPGRRPRRANFRQFTAQIREFLNFPTRAPCCRLESSAYNRFSSRGEMHHLCAGRNARFRENFLRRNVHPLTSLGRWI